LNAIRRLTPSVDATLCILAVIKLSPQQVPVLGALALARAIPQHWRHVQRF
jgi:hypothetical protein